MKSSKNRREDFQDGTKNQTKRQSKYKETIGRELMMLKIIKTRNKIDLRE